MFLLVSRNTLGKSLYLTVHETKMAVYESLCRLWTPLYIYIYILFIERKTGPWYCSLEYNGKSNVSVSSRRRGRKRKRNNGWDNCAWVTHCSGLLFRAHKNRFRVRFTVVAFFSFFSFSSCFHTRITMLLRPILWLLVLGTIFTVYAKGLCSLKRVSNTTAKKYPLKKPLRNKIHPQPT